jgi:ferritin-like metal-binding protein YciE
VEHYEIAAYGTVREFARILDEPKHASLLEQSLTEEKETDDRLTVVSKQVNTQAIAGNSDETRTKQTQLQKVPKRVA